ncbi:MAG: 7-cyano-7-deazaguanine synthase [Cyanobacteriota bacterium]|nr:7-cyano-7-deazaguanine synthase [Cyanobacteriota bacterium]
MKNHLINNRNYTLDFDPVQNSGGIVRFVDRSSGMESEIKLAIDDWAFSHRVKQEFPSIVADLIDLAVAIHTSDRLAVHNLRQDQRCIQVKLPVRHPELLSAKQEKLSSLLEWATGSQWFFEFYQRVAPERPVIEQSYLPVGPEGCEVALWSGGLDALAGVYTRLQEDFKKTFVLFGSGSNDIVYHRQETVARELQSIFPRRSHLYRVPIRFQNSNTHNKNKIPRARGVVFTLLGSACAYLMGQHELCVYENGIGAINLPYRASAIGLDHSRSVHPLTLLMVSEVVSELLGETFRVWNPFLFWTKAQMCQKLAEDGRDTLPSLSKSCDRPHRHQAIQCGYCSSCILRRQALAAAKLEDRTDYVIRHKEPAGDSSVYLRHMLAQIRTIEKLINTSLYPPLQWKAITQNFPELDDIVDRCSASEKLKAGEMRERLIQLYQNYVTEWIDVEPQLSNSLLKSIARQSSNSNCSVA